MSNKSNVVVGIALAAAAGAAIGFLFAPEKGEDLRKKVKQNANTWADELLAAIRKGKDDARQFTDNAQSKAASWKNKAKDEFGDVADTANRRVDASMSSTV
jgi:gas vesicle protein